MCRSTLFTVTLVTFTNGWNAYFWPKIIAKGEKRRVLTVGLAYLKNTFAGAESMNNHEIMAGAVMAVVPVIILFFIFHEIHADRIFEGSNEIRNRGSNMKIYAHRGYSGRYPENTMLAFQKAAETGCDGMELDVQLTKDGTVVVIHDEAVDRTTDGTGLVKDYTFEELRKLDAGTIKGGRYGFCPIPSFEEYCEWAGQYGFVTNVEIKTGVYYYEDIEEKTLELIRKYHLEDRVMFSSFNHLSLERMKELAPDIPRGALLEHAGLGNAGYYCSRFGYDFYHPGIKGLTKIP